MKQAIDILGSESLGVRGLCCSVAVGDRRIVIDPGVALGYVRHGQLPHPLQIAQGEQVRQRILRALEKATDVVFSHFHGDHVPLRHANPYQLAISQLPKNFGHLRAWTLSTDHLAEKMRQRALDLSHLTGLELHHVEQSSHGPLTFSPPMPHGTTNTHRGTVLMTRIDLGKGVFVHASDIQLLDRKTVDFIINWQPDVVLAAGPPLYLENIRTELRSAAWENALALATNVDTLILDHHLLRDTQGRDWLEDLSLASGEQIYCAADFMGTQRLFLEADRADLYKRMPVPDNWHDRYTKGETTTEEYFAAFPQNEVSP